MEAKNCVYVEYEGKLGVASIEAWNANNGFVPGGTPLGRDQNPAITKLLESIDPLFLEHSECMYVYKTPAEKNCKIGKRLLKKAGFTEVQFQQIVGESQKMI